MQGRLFQLWQCVRDQTEQTSSSKRSLAKVYKKIATDVVQHDIPKDLILNFDQTPLAFMSSGEYAMAPRGAKTIPIHDLNTKTAITGTPTVSATGKVLPLQLI